MKFDKEGKIIEQKKGFVVKVRDPEREKLRNELKIPIACPCCGNYLENWDDKFILSWGVCSNCYVDFIEGRTLPEELAGFDRDLKKMAEWTSEKKKAKENRLKILSKTK